VYRFRRPVEARFAAPKPPVCADRHFTLAVYGLPW
jgi:hypothetical protein